MNSSLHEMNARGLLCGPNESLEEFQKRIILLQQIQQDPGILQDCDSSYKIMDQIRVAYIDLDLDIDWVWMYTSRKGLSFWEPAATWILQFQEISIPLLQIKPRQKKLQEELLKHEAVHIARTTFQEPIYEEFLAYATSASRWRKIWGPLFRSAKESVLFIVLSLLPLIGMWLLNEVMILLIPILIFFGYLLGRLGIYSRIFKKALRRIKCFFKTDHPLKIALRLSDKEIRLFSSSSFQEIKEYINHQQCLRWKQIKASYKIK